MRERRFAAVELRADSRELNGVVMPYGSTATLPWGRELFEPGAFGTLDDVILNVQHDRARPLARTGGGGLTLTDSPEALTMRAMLPETRDGNDALVNVRGRILRGLSVEMEVSGERMEGDLRIVSRATLYGIGLVDRPAYSAAEVAARAAVVERQAPPLRWLW